MSFTGSILLQKFFDMKKVCFIARQLAAMNFKQAIYRSSGELSESNRSGKTGFRQRQIKAFFIDETSFIASAHKSSRYLGGSIRTKSECS